MKHSHIISFAAAIVAVFGIVAPAQAFVPIEFSIAEVYQAAEVIVVARSGPTREVVPKSDESFDHKTKMTLVKVLKGPATFPKSFELATNERAWGCEQDLDFPEGSKALLFLRWSPPDDCYRPVGRSEGCFLLTDALETEMNRRVPELAAILTVDDKAKREAALTEFYVQLALSPTTRAIGAKSLYLDTRHWLPLKTAQASAAQYRRMADVLLKERPPLDESPALVALLADYPDAAIDAYLIDSIRNANDPKWLPTMWRAVELLPKRLKVELPPELKADFEEHRRETYWIDGEMTRLEEYYHRQRPALMERLLKEFVKRM